MNPVVWMRGVVGTSMLVLLAACALGDKSKPVVAQPVVRAEGHKSVTVTVGQSGAEVELGLEQELVVRLATGSIVGYEWSLVDLRPGVLSGTGPKFERDLRGTTMDDATGQSIWRLRPSAPGAVMLRFEYRRPRNVEPATQVVTYNVTVR